MKIPDIRWEQRFANFNRALGQLQKAVDLSKSRELSELEGQGLIQSFEYTHELAWNVMKDYLQHQGINQISGSRDAFREAFKMGLIEDGEEWMSTLKSRQLTVHTYNEDVAGEILEKILQSYFSLFVAFQQKMKSLATGEAGDIFKK